ncbi:hypothetical protein JOQ06_025657 [Pogonophryne albipinna]|uniref:Uncharacterized protein n=1 Tax=Pogonophryne albipinna TaxID=1090488 RepID=A0AAD6AUX2_9TELE|nr:hypothetical protein JOQ06_025657 [Pogonophryne albipinna]
MNLLLRTPVVMTHHISSPITQQTKHDPIVKIHISVCQSSSHCRLIPHISPGNTCQNGLMHTLVRPTLPGIQTSLGMKQFFPFPLDTAAAISLFQGFNACT